MNCETCSNFPNGNVNTTFIEASQNGHLDVVKHLLEKGVNLNCKDNTGLTPLHHAASEGQGEIVKYLLENGASKLEKDDNGKSALNLAEEKGFADIVNLFAGWGYLAKIVCGHFVYYY